MRTSNFATESWFRLIALLTLLVMAYFAQN